ncbi:MAG: hypothetical protein ACK5MG_06815 [Bacteroidales bacterium]
MRLPINISLIIFAIVGLAACNEVDPRGYKIFDNNKDKWYSDREVVHTPLYKYANKHEDFLDESKPSSLLINGSKTVYMSDSSISVLFNYIQNGHDVLIFDDGFSITYDYMDVHCIEKYQNIDNVEFVLNDDDLTSCVFSNISYVRYFGLRPDNAEVLGYMQNGKTAYVNFICIPYGKGRLYLHLYQEVLQNEKFMNSHNLPYLNKMLSVIPNGKVYEFDPKYDYETPRPKNQALSFIMDNPPLRNAWHLILVALLIFVIFNARRKQRIVPIVRPLLNRTVEFVDSVSKLYLLKSKDNYELIAKKEVKYLLEFIRTKLFLNTSDLDDKFINELSMKTGMDIDDITSLINSVRRVVDGDYIDEHGLITLNSKIENFYKNIPYGR